MTEKKREKLETLSELGDPVEVPPEGMDAVDTSPDETDDGPEPRDDDVGENPADATPDVGETPTV